MDRIKHLQNLEDIINESSYSTIQCTFQCLEIVSLKPMYMHLALNKERDNQGIMCAILSARRNAYNRLPNEIWSLISSYFTPDVDEIVVKYIFSAARFNYAILTRDFHYFALKRLCNI